MSRRHHGRPRHGRPRQDSPRTSTGTTPAPGAHVTQPAPDAAPQRPASPPPPPRPSEAVPTAAASPEALAATISDGPPSPADPGTTAPPARLDAASPGAPPANGHATPIQNGQHPSNGCTAPQLRRFIKSRPYVPMHELRRRFAIDGDDDDVTQVRLESGHVYVGLPSREGVLLGELLRGGEIGYELSLDPRSPIVVGVYPMRPVPRG
jgi:hypothetical protein